MPGHSTYHVSWHTFVYINQLLLTMNLLSKVGSYGFLVEPFHCDFSNHIFIGHLGNHLLNAADFHSNERGYGMDYLNTVHKTWVLSRFVIEMNEMPEAYDRITVDTWVENVMKFFTSRNFAIRGKEGKTYGYGRSIWAMIDTDTRQPVDILKERDGIIMSYIEAEKECPIEPFKRVKVAADGKCSYTIDTHYSDVDVNGHINSVKYIEHILDLWTLDWYKEYRVQRIDIAYVAESHFGDKLVFTIDRKSDEECDILVQKDSNNGTEKREVCRCKIKFVKNC